VLQASYALCVALKFNSILSGLEPANLAGSGSEQALNPHLEAVTLQLVQPPI
jgi:hypothetical protein